jgi:3-hydroxyacyl-CoA dehydrogenase/3a,7a,12a-trihydroxy-5b-cholest-24-enoyl-CoA hydratase
MPNNLQIDPAKILHGEQYLELYKPLSTSGVLTPKPKLVDVLDKGSGAILIVNGKLFFNHKT